MTATLHTLPEPATFDTFWTKHYPHPRNRGSKKDACAIWNRTVKIPHDVCRAADAYAAYLRSPGEDWRPFPAMARTWLHGLCWEAWLETIEEDREACQIDQRLIVEQSVKMQSEQERTQRRRDEAAAFRVELNSDPARRDAYFEQSKMVGGLDWETFKGGWRDQ